MDAWSGEQLWPFSLYTTRTHIKDDQGRLFQGEHMGRHCRNYFRNLANGIRQG